MFRTAEKMAPAVTRTPTLTLTLPLPLALALALAYQAPAVILLDEIDSLLMARSDA